MKTFNLKVAQDYEGYYSGNVPDQISRQVIVPGAGTQDASQITMVFSKADKSIQMVNEFDSSLLANIAYIFNFSKGGAYGVYLDKLDRNIKLQALKATLEQNGYVVQIDELGVLKAWPQDPEQTTEQTQQEIDIFYKKLEDQGGTVFGINMDAVLRAAKSDAASSQSADPNLWEWIAVLHLGAVIVHEATHAKGYNEEVTPKQAEASFEAWALTKINAEYQTVWESDPNLNQYQFLGISSTGQQRAASNLRTAQFNSYLPPSITGKPRGSDLEGRYPGGQAKGNQGMSDWAHMLNSDESIAIESRLSRAYMFPIFPDISQEHDIIEEQLRKHTREDWKLDPTAITEQLLSEDHDISASYQAMESLLEEKRPKPLMMTLKKASNEQNETDNVFQEIIIFKSKAYFTENNSTEDAVRFIRNIQQTFEANPDKLKPFLVRISRTLRSKGDEGAQLVSKIHQILDNKHDLPNEQFNALMNGASQVAHITQLYREALDVAEGRWSGDIHDPIQSSTRSVIKEGTLFGWMNNLEISDGNTIPGLGDRVMAWDDRDEDFAGEESWIRQQKRYNPEYDLKGFYFRWIEPRFKPQLFDDLTRQYDNTHPALRFAQTIGLDEEASEILSILLTARNKIYGEEITATRFIMSEDIFPIIDSLFMNDPKINSMIYKVGEDLFSLWLCNTCINPDKVDVIEERIRTKDLGSDFNSELDDIIGASSSREIVIEEIIDHARDICKEFGIKDIYLAGGYPRDKTMGRPAYEVRDLDFSGSWHGQSIKFGGMLAKRLGIRNTTIDHRYKTIVFSYKGVTIECRGNFVPVLIRDQMKQHNIKTTPFMLDICNRDFTMNMLAYDFINDGVYDPTGKAIKALRSRTIKTLFDPDFILKENPLIILRALKFKIRFGFKIDRKLEKSMIEHVPYLFNGRYSEEKLLIGKDNVEEEGLIEARNLFEEFGLFKLMEL